MANAHSGMTMEPADRVRRLTIVAQCMEAVKSETDDLIDRYQVMTKDEIVTEIVNIRLKMRGYNDVK